MIAMLPNTTESVRAAALAAAAIIISLAILACVPLLLDQTSPAQRHNLPRTNRNIPLVPEKTPEDRLFEQQELPDPPAPEPILNAPPVELPEVAPPDTQAPATSCPDMTAAALASLPAVDLPVRVAVPLQGLALRPDPQRLAMNINPGKLHLPATAPTTGHRFNLDEVDRRPQGISTMQPLYPYQARRMAIEGYVTVRFLVTHNGSVDELTILKAEPEGVFEQAVKSTLRHWRFKPGQKNGRPVATWVKTSIEFKLQDAS
ncbi:periplasmic energy transduction protein, TonB-related protein [Syntrophotalea carbinolica DSM 2380]|uniref:Periplasmic energy transduction protein, TonB-related protein n=1 Tax=Syntrophotalea carbinolica (strain DSM 2380 / NBRC 103641 / GraBd1) TaxID=338963 RepID=Q3A6A6_SYNC1|nr:energy transducer TonB [Syntrophotalea carbinolica]ABA88101.1 periplasmic energy transduction protein, TonB-related protein [Syntrophotalea carbinolica DSM 2380]